MSKPVDNGTIKHCMKKFNFKGMLGTKKFIIIASFVGLFLISVGLSLIVFYLVAPKQASGLITKVNQKTKINLNLPKTEECPINGEKYTKAESDTWNTRRPITMMIENHVEARPESGLSRADVVYEAGYGTDPIFLHQGEANNICSDCPGGVKPGSEINSTVNALTLFDKLGWQGGSAGNNFDGGYNIGFPIVVRNQYRLSSTPSAWEHAVVADLDLVWAEAAKRNLGYKDTNGVPWTQGFRKWLFQDGKATTSPTASDIKFNFWDSMPGYDVEWKYNSATNSYDRFNAGVAHVDWEFDKPQLSAENVAIMFATEKGPLDSEHHMFYQVIGTGKALVFQNGQVITGTWKKASALDREVFYDTNEVEIKMVRGATWVEVVPAQNKVTY
jgi:hypothetical protein